MTTWVLVLSLLGQDLGAEPPLTPPPPPPPVAPEELTPDPRRPATNDYLTPEPLPPPMVEEPEAAPVDENAPGASVRVPAAVGFAALGGGIGAGAIYLVSQCRAGLGGSSDCFFAGLATTILSAGAIVAGGWGGHRLFGGKSSLGWAILGMSAGAIIGFVGYFFALSVTRATSVPGWVAAVPAAALGAVGAGCMVEVGHALVLREERGRARPARRYVMLPMPLRDGLALALAGEF